MHLYRRMSGRTILRALALLLLAMPGFPDAGAAIRPTRIVFSAIPGSTESDAPQCQNRGDTELFTIGPNDHGFRRLTNTRMREVTPNWRRDRRKLVFIGFPFDSLNGEIYTMRANGTRRKQLTDTAQQREYFPEWSPDGKRILFMRTYPKEQDTSSGSDKRNLIVTKSDGTRERALTERRIDPYLSGAWAPDSRRIVYTSQLPGDSGDNGMFIKNLRSGRKRMILRSHDQIQYPDWSLDGRWIIYYWQRYGEGHIWRIRPDGTREKKLTKAGYNDAAWSPSGNRIATVRASEKMCQDHVFIMRADGTRERELFRNRDLEVYWVDW